MNRIYSLTFLRGLISSILPIVVLSFVKESSALICGETQCQPSDDYCCLRSDFIAASSRCCSSQENYRSYEGAITGLVVAVIILIIFALCNLWKKCISRRERSRMTSNDYSWDVPPDYDSLKHTFDKELPTYHTLYETSAASKKSSQNVDTQSHPEKPPPDYECSCRPSTSRMACSQISVPKDVLMAVTFIVETGKEKSTQK